jgi:hypothetical protein
LQRKFFLAGYYRTAELLSEWAVKIYPTPTFGVYRYYSNAIATKYGYPDLPRVSHRVRATYLTTLHEQLDYVEKAEIPYDRFHGLLGFSDHIMGGIVRYNRNLHRYEFRTPVVYQSQRSWVSGGYPRLLARLLRDESERIAIRDRKIKMAWVSLPVSQAFT